MLKTKSLYYQLQLFSDNPEKIVIENLNFHQIPTTLL